MILRRTPSQRSTRRGSVYIMVLGLVLLMMASGAAAVAMSRVRARTLSQANDTIRAEALAESALDYATLQLATNPLWRNAYTSGVEVAQMAFAGGTISFKFVDETDGTLSNNSTDPVRVYGIGRYGKATQSCSVVVTGSTALSCLNSTLTVRQDLNFNRSFVYATGMTLAANGDIHGGASPGSTVNGNIEAGGAIYVENAFFNGTQKSGLLVTKRDMPSANVFDYYTGKGTWIPYTSLPVDSSNGGRKIEKVVLSPASNPFSSTLDTDGVYVINCAGARVNIMDCRIVGTIVLLDPAPTSLVSGDVSWTAAITNFPCLLVRGSMVLSFGTNPTPVLSESSLLTNFNPAGTPYPYLSGTANATTTDTYPSIIDGLVYVSGNASGDTLGLWTHINMLIVGGNYDAQRNSLYFAYHGVYTDYPPPGFTGTGTGTLSPIAGTYRKELAP